MSHNPEDEEFEFVPPPPPPKIEFQPFDPPVFPEPKPLLLSIEVPKEIRKMSSAYSHAMDGDLLKKQREEVASFKSGLFWNTVLMIVSWLTFFGCYHYLEVNNLFSSTNAVSFFEGAIIFFSFILGLIAFFSGIFSSSMTFLHLVFFKKTADEHKAIVNMQDRTPEEDEIIANKLNRMAYRVVRQIDLVNNYLTELNLHRRMKELDMSVIDHDRAEEILEKAYDSCKKELERLKVLLELKARREDKGIDLVSDIGLLEESSRDSLAELAAELEIDPENILGTLQSSLQLDAVNAELGDVGAIERERSARKKKTAGAIKAQTA